jgi:hypothetical protein
VPAPLRPRPHASPRGPLPQAALPFIIETPKHDARGREMDPVNLRLLRWLAGNTQPPTAAIDL